MGSHARRTGNKAQRKRAAGRSRAIGWAGVILVVALVGYGLSQMSGVAYSERDLAPINFSGLTSAQKQSALETANAARCSCGCGLGLAQCVATDSTCPIREDNIKTIRGMVDEASRTGGKS